MKPERVRETVRAADARSASSTKSSRLIHAALRNGKPQPWMYEALALAMQAGGSRRPRSSGPLMSAVDFGDSAEDFMYVAQYMARIGLEPGR